MKFGNAYNHHPKEETTTSEKETETVARLAAKSFLFMTIFRCWSSGISLDTAIAIHNGQNRF